MYTLLRLSSWQNWVASLYTKMDKKPPAFWLFDWSTYSYTTETISSNHSDTQYLMLKSGVASGSPLLMAILLLGGSESLHFWNGLTLSRLVWDTLDLLLIKEVQENFTFVTLVRQEILFPPPQKKICTLLICMFKVFDIRFEISKDFMIFK